MRYAPPGFCLNDFEIVRENDICHLIHLHWPPVHPFDAARLETSYGHATSADLIKALLHNEYCEVYFDDILVMTGIAYRHLEGKFGVKIDGSDADFYLGKYSDSA